MDAEVAYFQMHCRFPSWTSRVRTPSPAPRLLSRLVVYSQFFRLSSILHALPQAVLRDDPRQRSVPHSRGGFPVSGQTMRIEAECYVLVRVAEAFTDDRERRSVAQQDRRVRVAQGM